MNTNRTPLTPPLPSPPQNTPLDVNTATEEQLAALPGLSAPLAANIVAHRAALGGFQQPEDLALVNGVGAARLHRIRAGLCVGQSNNRSVSGRGAEQVRSGGGVRAGEGEGQIRSGGESRS